MSEQNYTWEQLNAYVDGELPPETAARLAASAAENVELAKTIAALSELKAASHRALDFEDDDTPALPHPPAGHRRATGWKRPCALAASLLALAVASSAVWFGLQDKGGENTWITAAQEQHQDWINSDSKVRASEQSAVQNILMASEEIVEVSIEGAIGYAPSLAPAGMRITRFSSQRDESGEFFFVGYLGRNGCQLSLTVTKAPESQPVALSLEWQENDKALASWRVEDTAYAAIAQGMDRQRFQQLTAHLETATREADAQQRETRMAEATRNSDRPCLS
ncbi:hypothetical protein [Fodinicurvata sediminis]|uniref:hypothetical protein n=1 Tax=Fodinicurvata sediminis TaxID=1121832 RepID=UPI0003B68F04|nr:hypothetical protein [Fodinicurvata sediminis]